jgi:dCMP deaminase
MLGLTNVPIDQIRIARSRPTWDHIFLREADLWAQRSHDPQTQCGCVLVKHTTVLSTGYNGFIGEINDDVLPNLRPYKYPFMIHAELNAVLNCARFGVSTVGATAYVTIPPCNFCLQYLWQAGISRVVHSDSVAQMMQNEQYERERNALLLLMGDRMDISCIPSKVFREK